MLIGCVQDMNSVTSNACIVLEKVDARSPLSTSTLLTGSCNRFIDQVAEPLTLECAMEVMSTLAKLHVRFLGYSLTSRTQFEMAWFQF